MLLAPTFWKALTAKPICVEGIILSSAHTEITNRFTVKSEDHSIVSKEIKRLLQIAIYHTQFSTLCRVTSSYGLQSE